jgi:hypothetical protein
MIYLHARDRARRLPELLDPQFTFRREGEHLFVQGAIYFHVETEEENHPWEEWWQCPMCLAGNFWRYPNQNHYGFEMTCSECAAHLQRFGAREWRVTNAAPNDITARLSLAMTA